jgi:hypothetical protein
MTSNCRLCQVPFDTTNEENDLRERISGVLETGPIPPMDTCLVCRMRQLMAWRNERTLYRRKCDKTGQSIISVYPEDAPFPVYERTVWHGDSWDALDYGLEYDFERPFFEQFAELQKKVPRSSINASRIENCDFCNFGFDSRNCYISPCTYFSESLLYCYFSLETKDCTDCSFCFQCENCLWCTDCNKSNNCIYCTLSHQCSDSAYLYDCRSCHECFGCVGLRHKKHCIFNEQLSKEEYEKRVAQFDLQNPSHWKAVKKKLGDLRLNHPHLYSVQDKTENCTGDYVFESKNCINCYQMYRSEDSINIQDADETVNCLDCYHIGWSDYIYDSCSPVRQKGTAFVCQCWDGNDMFYSDNCMACSHCFGCVGLSHKQYCILNKQYSKEEYLDILKKIVDQMKTEGAWGQYFPPNLSPFAYNETCAQEYYPLTKEEALKYGWRWKDDLPFTTGKETITDVPERIEDVQDSIVDEILACESCKKNYRIIPQELKFYRNKQLSIPRLCPECRHLKRLRLRNSRNLHDRNCDKCRVNIQATYSKERPEKVLCEKCYLETVY